MSTERVASRGLSLESLAAFEASKRRKRHPRPLSAAEPYPALAVREKRTPPAGQLALAFTVREP